MTYPRSASRRLLVGFASILLSLTAALIVAAAGVFNVRLLSVGDNNLAPALRHGDAVVIVKTSANSLGQGDVAGYYTGPAQTTIHEGKVVSISPARQNVTVAEANGSLTKVNDSAIVGRTTIRLNGLGYLLEFLQTLPGLIIGLYLPAVIIVWFELKRLLVHYERLVYRLPGYASH